ncbi:MAG TPA: DMT family transporter [Candidatus Paceibacterota bacterium]|nr:DMT family transporter [Candidatus Paceibacterota bacterium]
MQWFFIALGAPFLWALVNISDQYLVANYSTGKRGSGGLVLFSSLIGLFVALIIGIFTSGIFGIPILDKILLVITGGITIAWIILYLFTLEIEDVSAVVPWFLTIPIFGYVLGYVFLGETLTTAQFIGSGIVLFGVSLISINFSGQKKKLNWRPAVYMIIACFLIAIAGVIFKYVTIGDNFWISSFWEYAGLGGFGVLIYFFVPKYRKEFMLMNRSGGKKIFLLNTTSEILTIGGNLLTNYAILLAPVAMVYLVSSFQPAIVLFLTLLATKFFPNVAKENIKGRVLLPKIIAIVIMIVGSAILFL